MLRSFYILIWITAFKLLHCQLSMGLGNESLLGKKYLVYFVKSQYSNSDDDTWLCEGAIVTPTQILTAATCLVEISRIYAIAGYKKYVNARDIEKDKCTKTWKKKVVMISVPKEYTTSSNKKLEWMNVDIGVATVQEPYDFNDITYLTHCSYIPETIMINFDKTNEVENTHAIALGWGGRNVKGPELQGKTLSPKLLQETTTIIIDKTFCANLVPKNGSKEIVNKYLLCASGNGILGENEEENVFDPISEEQSTKGNIFINNVTTEINKSNEINSRKSALVETCQNDHGGPLITWISEVEMILGVALNGICNKDLGCAGPRIYVSTAATTQIIKCLLETNDTRRKTCNNEMDDEKYQVKNMEIKWPEDLKNNSTFSINIQETITIPSFRRQNEEDALNLRPTKDLRTFSEQRNMKEISHDNQYENLKENPFKNRQENLELKTQHGKAQQRYMIQQQIESQNPPEKYNFNQPHMKPQNQPEITSFKQPQMESQNHQEKTSFNQQQMETQNKPEITSFNQPQMEFQRQPEITSFNEPQMESQKQPEITSFNQPLMESYNQPPMDAYYNQPQIDSYYNQPQMESNNPLESEPYNQPQTQSNNQPPHKPNNQKPMVPYQPEMHSFNQQHMATQNNPQQPINKDKINQQFHPMNNPPPPKPPRMQPLKPSPVHLYNQPQIESFQEPQADSFNEELTDQNLFSSFNKPPDKPFANPQLESLNNSELGSLKLQQSNVDPYREPLSPNGFSKIESFETKPTKAYNPLDIIMAEDEVAINRPMEEPYILPHEVLRKQPSVHDMPQSHKPELDTPFEQPHLSTARSTALRNRPQDYLTNPFQGDSKTFEQIISQFHSGPDPTAWAPTPQDKTFDEIYRNLHDGEFEEPQDQEFGTRFEHPFEQEVEQTDTRVTEPPANEPHNEIQMRHQLPLEYPDFSQRRTN